MKFFIISAFLAVLHIVYAAESPVRLEAEDYVLNREILSNRPMEGKWDIWTSDSHAERWSGGKVLRGMGIRHDRSADDVKSAVLHFRIPVPRTGVYDIVAVGGRTFGVSLDGKNFKRCASGEVIAEKITAPDGFWEFRIANMFAENNPGSQGAPYLDYFELRPVPPPKPKVKGFASTRVVEKLNRGVIALPFKEGGVYVSWRLLSTDPENIGFDVFRSRTGQTEKLNAGPVIHTTDYLDPTGLKGDVYIVRPAGNASGVSGESPVWQIDENGLPHLSFKYQNPRAQAMCPGIGDLDGDGTYDYVVKTPNANIDPYERYWKRSPGTYQLEAFRSDGTPLWTRDLGWAIEQGVWYSPFIVFDFDGDGRAEVVLKQGEGDPRDADGKVTSGPEYLVVLDGLTGKEIARAPWPDREGFENYNLASRNQLAAAYLDGKTPAILALRGTYGRMKVEAWQLNAGKLENLWKFDNKDMPRKFRGQGAHATVSADVDGDGRDEVILGSMVLDDNGDVLWSTGKGHPDYVYLSDIIPDRPGLEIAYILEIPQPKGGVCVVDAATGKSIWEVPDPTKHVHYGYCIDTDPTVPGMEVVGIDRDGGNLSPRRWRYSGDGKLLNYGIEVGQMRRGIYWDADLEKEVCINEIADFNGGPVGFKFPGRWIMNADILGDWREEVVVTLPGEMRIYATTIPAMDRRVCLMQESSYRWSVLGNSQGYYSEAQLPYFPPARSVNFSLIAKQDGDVPQIQVTVSAPQNAGVSGMVKIQLPAGLKTAQPEWSVNLKPGEISVKIITIQGTISGDMPVKATLTIGDRIRAGQVLLREFKIPQLAPGTLRFPAAKITSETGGQSRVIEGRPGAPEGCLSYWDNPGHRISWTLNVPKSGNYRLQISRASGGDAERSLTVNGTPLGKFTLSASGGNGMEASDWHSYTFAPVLQLQAGRNTITLENTNGTLQNLAYLYLKPADE